MKSPMQQLNERKHHEHHIPHLERKGIRRATAGILAIGLAVGGFALMDNYIDNKIDEGVEKSREASETEARELGRIAGEGMVEGFETGIVELLTEIIEVLEDE